MPSGQTRQSRSLKNLLFFRLAQSPQEMQKEQRLLAEMNLVLDGYTILALQPGVSDFDTLPLTQQIDIVFPHMVRHNTLLAMWRTETPQKQLLQLLVASRGRAMLRQYECQSRTGCEAILALATGELLKSTYLFDEFRIQQKPQIVQAAPEESALAEAGIQLSGLVSSGLYGHTGPSLNLGGCVAIDIRFWQTLSLALALQVSKGPLEAPFDASTTDGTDSIRYWTLGPQLVLSYAFHLESLQLAPLLGVQIHWTEQTTKLGKGPLLVDERIMLRALAGVQARWFVLDNIALVFAPTVGNYFWQNAYYRKSDDSLAYATPWVDVSFEMGLFAPF